MEDNNTTTQKPFPRPELSDSIRWWSFVKPKKNRLR